MQRGGCAPVVRLLFSGGGTAWAFGHRHFHERAESSTGPAVEKATGNAVWRRVRTMDQASGQSAKKDIGRAEESQRAKTTFTSDGFERGI